MSQGTFDDKSTLVQVMVWCCPATSHYLSQCRQRSLLLYGITRPPCFDTGTQTCVSELGRHWIMQVSQVPSYYLNQCYNLNRNRTLRKSDHCILFTCFENVSKQVAISVIFFLQQGLKSYWEKRRDNSLTLVEQFVKTLELNMPHITPNFKIWDHSDIPSDGT